MQVTIEVSELLHVARKAAIRALAAVGEWDDHDTFEIPSRHLTDTEWSSEVETAASESLVASLPELARLVEGLGLDVGPLL